jgi:hypothetical protein
MLTATDAASSNAAHQLSPLVAVVVVRLVLGRVMAEHPGGRSGIDPARRRVANH